MVTLGYSFLPRTPENEAIRRFANDWHANVAQISQLVVILAIPWARYALSNKVSSDLDSYFGREIAKGRGTYGQWIFGVTWAAWMGFLIVNDTMPDYLGLVKRFGIVAASQLPLHYLLSMSQSTNPLNYILPKGSCRQLLPLHFVTGRLLISSIAVHGVLYTNLFYQLGFFWASIKQTKIVVALISMSLFVAIAVTAQRAVRRKARAVFWYTHLAASTAILPLMYFHVVHVRLYLYESAVIVALNALARMAM